MMYRRRSFTTDGVGWVSAELDPATRVATLCNRAGQPIGTRPFTAKENAEADAIAAREAQAATELALTADARVQLQAMRASIGPGDAPAGTDSLNAIINTPNSAINQSPAPIIKALARLVRELTRATIRLGRLAARDFDTPAD